MLRLPLTALLLALVSYSTLWTALRGESYDGDSDYGSGSGNDSVCMPCDLGTEPDKDSGFCNCTSCNCSLLGGPTPSPSFLSLGFLRQTCNCSGFCEYANTSCRQCAAGHYADTKGLPKCKKCPVGTFTNDLGSHICQHCHIGQYSDTTGATQCSDCPEGAYAPDRGATFCHNCTAGTFNNATGQGQCRSCEDGHYVDSIGATECFVCGNGTYTNSSTGHAGCRHCDPGHICNKTGCGNCTACPLGTSSKDPTKCTDCPIGTYASREGSTKCTFCENGTVCKEGRCASCSPCELGSQPANGHSLYECEPCDPGTYRDDTVGYFCTKCPEGYYQVDSGQKGCTVCPKGYYCPYPSTEPRICPDDAKCPHGSMQPLFCRNFYTYSDNEEKCVPKAIFYITITLVVFFVILVITLVGCTVYWNFIRKKTSSYEKLPLSRSFKKQPVSEPVYLGH